MKILDFTRFVVLLLSLPLLMANLCRSDSIALDDDEESCLGSPTCDVSISFKNFSSEPVHLWYHSENIGPGNRLSPGADRCFVIRSNFNETASFTFFAGRDGASIATRSFSVKVEENIAILVDWNTNNTLTVRSRSGGCGI